MIVRILKKRRQHIFLFTVVSLIVFVTLRQAELLVSRLRYVNHDAEKQLDGTGCNCNPETVKRKSSKPIVYNQPNLKQNDYQISKQPSKSGVPTNSPKIDRRKELTLSPKEEDDLLMNISVKNIEHIKESPDFNQSEFYRWCDSYLGKNITENVFSLPQYSIKPVKLCDKNTDLIILMPTPPNALFARELIRQTWASPIYRINEWPGRSIALNSKIVFIIGTGLASNQSTINSEASLYNDILAADFADSYRNLTLKMLVGLNWVSTACPRVKFVLKCDLDTFINLPLMTRLLLEVSGKVKKRFILGHKHIRILPPVLREGKWMVSEKDYPLQFFPRYFVGHSYVISGDLVHELVTIPKTLPLLPIEDSYFTGIAALIIKATRLHFQGFAFNSKKERDISCDIIHNKDVSSTKISLNQMLLLWRYVLLNTCNRRKFMSQSDDEVERQVKGIHTKSK